MNGTQELYGKKKETHLQDSQGKKKIGEFEDDCLWQENWMKNKREFCLIY